MASFVCSQKSMRRKVVSVNLGGNSQQLLHLATSGNQYLGLLDGFVGVWGMPLANTDGLSLLAAGEEQSLALLSVYVTSLQA